MSEMESGTPRFERKATLRLGQRELSLISLAVILAVVIFIMYAGYGIVRNFNTRRDIVYARNNLQKLSAALYSYRQDWDGKFPAAATWTDSVRGYLSVSPGTPGGAASLLHGGSDHDGEVGYVFNDLATEYNIDQPDKNPAALRAVSPDKIILLIERPGAPLNAHLRIPPQTTPDNIQAFYKELAYPHYTDDPNNATTLYLTADGKVREITRRDTKE